MNRLTCFKAYDVRGKLGEEINNEIAYRIGRAYAQYLDAGHVIDAIEVRVVGQRLRVEFIKAHHEPDGSFPIIAHLPVAREKAARCTWTPVTA